MPKSAKQAEALADGEVSEEEYRAGFERFRECLADDGFELRVTGESYDLIDYAIPADAVDAGADLKCYGREFSAVDNEWQLAHLDTSRSTEVLRECLLARGIEPEATTAEIVKQIEAAGIDYRECV